MGGCIDFDFGGMHLGSADWGDPYRQFDSNKSGDIPTGSNY